MTYSDYSLTKDGSRGYTITLPCFLGDDDFTEAKLMNRFYESVMGELYLFAEYYVSSAERRASFKCKYFVESDESIIEVKLEITTKSDGSRSMTQVITHRWKHGIIIKKL